MDGPGTAIEQFFNQLIRMRLLTQVFVSDKEGEIVLECFGSSSTVDADTDGNGNDGHGGTNEPEEEEEEDLPPECNVIVSGVRCFQNLEQLQLGNPSYIAAQYHDAVVVQLMEQGGTILTLIGSRSQGHFTGGLLALVPQIQRTASYANLLEGICKCDL